MPKHILLIIIALSITACNTAQPSPTRATPTTEIATTAPTDPPIATAAVMPSTPTALTPERGQEQNILLIIADDYGIDRMGLYNPGRTDLPPTPTLDALAAQGVLFENAWSAPICSPTRATMLTGRYGFRTNIGWRVYDGQPGIRLDEFTLPMALDAGSNNAYAHANIGKWHLSDAANGDADNPNQMGYDHYSGILQGGVQDYSAWREVTNGTSQLTNSYATTKFVDDSLTWIEAQHATDTPWFLWLAFNAPHTPFHLPPADLHSFDNLSGTTADIEANPNAYYAAMVEAMDTEIGRLLDSMPPAERAQTTVIFIGDNGTARQVIDPNYNRQQAKGSLHSGGIHVPLLISGAAITAPGRREPALVNSVDIYATVLDLAGIEMHSVLPSDTTVDAVSMLPYITNTAHNAPRTFIWSERFNTDLEPRNNVPPGITIRNAQYKLVQFDDATEFFYDLTTDKYEANNLLEAELDAPQTAAYCALQSEIITLYASADGATVPTLPDRCLAAN